MSNNSDNETLFVSRKVEQKKKPLPYIKARILWPALGFPEVVAPERPITLLLLCDKEGLTSQDVAMYLRYTEWDKRTLRYSKTTQTAESGGFFSNEISTPISVKIHEKDDLTLALDLANLSKFVYDFYEDNGLKHFYEIVIWPHKNYLSKKLYNIFWINKERKNPQSPTISAELKFLKDRFVQKRKPEGRWYKGDIPHPPEGEYMSEYQGKPWAQPFVEVLHPLFIAEPKQKLKIAHLADHHVCVRNDMFQKAIDQGIKFGYKKGQFNNYNKNTENAIAEACSTCDILIHGGDLIDFGRGHDGTNDTLGKEQAYQLDRNWFPFYKFLASGNNYKKPMYTVLGNHDWRPNPYGPVCSFYSIANDMNLTHEQVKAIHGPNAEEVWYAQIEEVHSLSEYFSRLPVFTTDIDSVKWYLLLINPFLDFIAQYPGGFALIGYDWAENEEIIDLPGSRLVGLPIAEDSLTSPQIRLTKKFLALDDCTAKIAALHAPIIAPHPYMESGLMDHAQYICPDCKGSGKKNHADCSCLEAHQVRIGDGPFRPAHPGKRVLYGCRSDEDSVDFSPYWPVYGTIKQKRSWLIREFGKHKVGLVLSGHSHRNSAFRLENGGDYHNPRALFVHDHNTNSTFYGPLYMSTTSIGPVGFKHTRFQQEHIKPAFCKIAINKTGQIDEPWSLWEVNLPLLWQSENLKPFEILILFEEVAIHDDSDWFGAGEIYFKGTVGNKPVVRSDVFETSSGEKPIKLPTRQWSFKVPVPSPPVPINLWFEAWDEEVFSDECLGKVTMTLNHPNWNIGFHSLKSQNDNFTLFMRIDGRIREPGDYPQSSPDQGYA